MDTECSDPDHYLRDAAALTCVWLVLRSVSASKHDCGLDLRRRELAAGAIGDRVRSRRATRRSSTADTAIRVFFFQDFLPLILPAEPQVLWNVGNATTERIPPSKASSLSKIKKCRRCAQAVAGIAATVPNHSKGCAYRTSGGDPPRAVVEDSPDADYSTCPPGQLLSAHTYCAIIGERPMLPGVHRVRVTEKPDYCFVFASYAEVAVLGSRDEIRVADCTLFHVEHLGWGSEDINSVSESERSLERTLTAINECLRYCKAIERLQTSASFARQVGRADVKLFVVVRKDDKQIVWANPVYRLRAPFSFTQQFLSRRYSSQIAENPLPPVVKRAMACVDLFNLGFYTEAFITLFSLVDDLTQNVVKAGLEQRGLSAGEQKDLMMAIKEARLERYLNLLMKVAGGKSLLQDQPLLSARLKIANSTRNDVMHDSTRIERQQAAEHIDTLLDVINWLRGNAFNFAIPPFPVLAPARSEFHLLDPNEPASPTTPGPAPGMACEALGGEAAMCKSGQVESPDKAQ